jgi:hypothetical protein
MNVVRRKSSALQQSERMDNLAQLIRCVFILFRAETSILQYTDKNYGMKTFHYEDKPLNCHLRLCGSILHNETINKLTV